MQSLIVTSKIINQKILENCLRTLEYRPPITAGTVGEALEQFEAEAIDLVMVGKEVSDASWLELVSELRDLEDGGYTPILMIGDQFTEEEVVKAIQTGINQILLMPLTTAALKAKIQAVQSVPELLGQDEPIEGADRSA